MRQPKQKGGYLGEEGGSVGVVQFSLSSTLFPQENRNREESVGNGNKKEIRCKPQYEYEYEYRIKSARTEKDQGQGLRNGNLQTWDFNNCNGPIKKEKGR